MGTHGATAPRSEGAAGFPGGQGPAGSPEPGGVRRRRSARLHLVPAGLAAVVCLAALAGWLAGEPRLATFLPGRAAMAPMTALGILAGCAAVAALPAARGLAFRLGLADAAAGIGIVLAHLAEVPAEAGAVPPGWWSSPVTGTLLAVAGLASALLARGLFAAGQALSFGLVMASALIGLGHAFPAADLYDYLPGTGVALPTVVAFAALGLGQLLACRHSGIASALTSRSSAGKAGLRLLLASSCAIALLSAIVLSAHRLDAFDVETTVLTLSWGALGILGATLWGLAVVVDRADAEKLRAEHDRDSMRRMVAAAVTHDLRSPLHTAALSAGLLEALVTEPKAQSLVRRLQGSHRRLDRLLRSLLDSLALDGSRRLALDPAPVALEELVAEVVAENPGPLGGRVRVDGAADGWWDREALFRVIENLLLNARKYGDGEAPILCRIAADGPDAVALAVQNRGRPIPEAEWDAIFQPFTRGEDPVRTGQPGWGVGLAYARLVAAAHGGSIRVAASGPEGTVFELRLPRDARRA